MLGDSTVERISSRDEQRMVRALEHMIECVNTGDAPTKALVKASLEHELSRNFVDRVAEAYNISRTMAQIKQADANKRAADFQMADARKAADEIWPEIKAAADWSAPDPAVETANFWPKGPTLTQLLGMEKGAQAKSQDWPIALEFQDSAKLGEIRRTELAKNAAYARAAELRDNLLGGISKIAQYLRMHGADSLAEVESRTICHFGDQGRAFIDFLCKAAEIQDRRAPADDKRNYVFPDREPYRTIEACIKTASWLDQAVDTAASTTVRLENLRKAAGLVDLRKTAETEKAAVGLGGVSPLAAAAVTLPYLGFKERTSTDAAEKWRHDVHDPELEAEEADADVKVMMSDFLNNDPIISGYPEPTVRQAYNQVARMAPLASREPLIMRGFLRRMLQQDSIVEAHEAEQLAKLEKSLRGSPSPA